MLIGMASTGMIAMYFEIFGMVEYVSSSVIMQYFWVDLSALYTSCKEGENLMLV